MEEKIKQAIEGVFELPDNWLTIKSREGEIPFARYFYYYFVKEAAQMEGSYLSNQKIGDTTGFDRATVDYGLRRLNDLLQVDQYVIRIFTELRSQIFGGDDYFSFFINSKRVAKGTATTADLDKMITFLRMWKAEIMGRERYAGTH